jgi:hypothetical protein
MTSEALAECFVYITLPGQTDPVTAGRFALAVGRRGTVEGRFVYGRSYLERPNAVALDPVELKLSPRTYSTAALDGVFGALRDAARTIGADGSFNVTSVKRSLENWITFCTRQMTAQGLSGLATTKSRPLPSAASTRPLIWRTCSPSPMPSWRTKNCRPMPLTNRSRT